MATGSITSLGIGSGLDLQNILDQLKGVDQTRITAKETKKTDLQNEANAYSKVNAKLFSIKSYARDLSLESNYLSNSVSITDEDVMSATIGDGHDAASFNVEVTRKAQRNSWGSAAIADKQEIMFAEPATGISDTGTTAAISADETLSIEYGTPGIISTDSSIAPGTTDASFAINGINIGVVTVLDDKDSDNALRDAINLKTDDHGVTASLDSNGILTLTSEDHSDIAVTMTGSEAVFGGTGAMSDTGQTQIDVSLTAGMTLAEITDTINNSANNKDANGNQLVTASFKLGDDGSYFVRLAATSGGNTADSQVSVSGFSGVAADRTTAITQGDDTMYLSVPPGTTYEGMTTLINESEDNPGVTAAMIDNGDSVNPYQLTLTADDTGEDARISLINFSELAEISGAAAQSLNAGFTVNGITYSRQSNTGINDVIAGVTFDLKKIGESTVNVEVNHDTVKDDITAMIQEFNDLVTYITKGTETDATDTDEDTATAEETDEETDNPLENSSSANRIVFQLKSLLNSVLDFDTGYTSLSDLGLEFSSTGTISIDEKALDQAISTDPDAVKSLFVGDSDKEVTGLADLINTALADMVSSTGISTTEIDEAESKITRLDKDIETETERLTKKYETMAREFAQLDSYISQLNSEASALTSMITAFSEASK